MTIEHNEDLLDDIYEEHEHGIDYNSGRGMFESAAKQSMREYHEKMTRWIPIDDDGMMPGNTLCDVLISGVPSTAYFHIDQHTQQPYFKCTVSDECDYSMDKISHYRITANPVRE